MITILRCPTAAKAGVQQHLVNLSYEDIRAEAALHAKLRAECFQKAAKAHSSKQGELAVFYAQQVNYLMYIFALNVFFIKLLVLSYKGTDIQQFIRLHYRVIFTLAR